MKDDLRPLVEGDMPPVELKDSPKYRWRSISQSSPLALKDNNSCTVIAWTAVFDCNYDTTYEFLRKHVGRVHGRGIVRQQIHKAFSLVRKSKVEKLDLPRMNLKKFIELHPEGRYYVLFCNHAMAVIDGKIYDFKDSSRRFVTDVWKVTPC